MLCWLESADLIFGLMLGVWITQNYWRPVLPIKVTILPAEKEVKPKREWLNLLEPHIRKFEVAAALEGSVTYNTKGSWAMAKVLREVARALTFAENELSK